MTRRVGNTVIIEVEDDDTCELCGKVDELRPYGPKGERICYDCGQKDPATTERVMEETLYGCDEVVIGRLQ